MPIWALSLGSVVAVSLVSLVGIATLSLDEGVLRRLATTFVSFAVGALLGDAFIHLIPEAFARGGDALVPSLLVLAGVVLFFVLEKLLRHARARREARSPSGGSGLPVLASINLVGDALHNFVDGALIAASYLVSPELGVTTTVAVVLHEIPQELADFGVLVHSGLSVRKAVLLNLASASVALVGMAVTLLAGATLGETVSVVLVPVTAGGFVYIAAAVLIPELQRERGVRSLLEQTVLVVLGIALMALLARLE